ncbi:MAG TPA: antibiotic biosynthesis monooxygenase [Ktedonobacterales bacterium]|jgi:heme-degrading monooxygenase HmoA|nr:antibiotic biosynthesis monooxygenase [Ktedonobacterales bacterium]
MFVAVNRITAPQQAMDRMVEGFRRNAESLKQFEGFLALELWRGETTLEAVSKWASREAFEAWANSDSFLASHGFARGQGGQQGAQGAQGGGATVAYYEGDVLAQP